MINSFDELFQSAVDMPHYQLVQSARHSISVVSQYLNLVTGEIQTSTVLMVAIGTFLAADGQLSHEEYRFMQDVFECDGSFESLKLVVESSNDMDIVNNIDKLMDHAPKDVKVSFLALCLDCIACDGEITPSEKALLLKYLED